MRINIADVLSREDGILQKKEQLAITELSFPFGTFPIAEKSPVNVIITNMGKKKILLLTDTHLTVEIPCDRCLKVVKTEFHLDFSKELDFSKSDEKRIEELDEIDYLTDTILDVDRLIYSELLIQWPMKILCSETCKGISHKCGTNLNEKECGCDRTELDPRMAVIRDVFNNS